MLIIIMPNKFNARESLVIFDLSPDEFFYTLVHTFTRFQRDKAKERTDLFYLIMGLNHLRESVAPGYRHSAPAKTADEKFHNYIHDHCPELRIMNTLCNRAKHDVSSLKTSVKYDLSMSDWPSISSVVKFSHLLFTMAQKT